MNIRQPVDLQPFYFAGGHIGIVLAHGFTGSPLEMRPLGRFLADKGLTVRGLRLPGHGQTPEAMLQVRWQHWAAAVDEAVQELSRECDHVFVCGHSMGASLSLYVASQRTVAGVITMAAPVIRATEDWRVRMLGILKRIVRWYDVKEEPLPEPLTPLPPGAMWAYSRVPLSAVHELDRLVGVTGLALPGVTAPVLILASEQDPIVKSKHAYYIYDHVRSLDKELLWFNRSGHTLPADVESTQIWHAIYDFIITRTTPAQPRLESFATIGLDSDVATVLRMASMGIDQPGGLGQIDNMIMLKSEASEDAEAVGAAEFSAEQVTSPEASK